jgi:hypothetical protein
MVPDVVEPINRPHAQFPDKIDGGLKAKVLLIHYDDKHIVVVTVSLLDII